DLLAGFLLGAAHQFAGQIEEATAIDLRMYALRPDLQFGADSISMLTRTGRGAEREQLQLSWLERAPDSEQALNARVAARLDRRKIGEAERELRRLVLIDGVGPHRLTTLADVLLISGRTGEAMQLGEQLLRGGEKERSDGYYRIAEASLLDGRF